MLRPNRRVDREKAQAFLEGDSPDMELAIGYNARFEEAAKAVSHALQGREAGRFGITVITGGAGAGKSMALLQVCVAFARHFDADLLLSSSPPHEAYPVADLPRGGRRWLLAIDDADADLEAVLTTAEALQADGRDDVDLAFACNRIEWNHRVESVPDVTARWSRVKAATRFAHFELRQLTQSDADTIARAWQAHGLEIPGAERVSRDGDALASFAASLMRNARGVDGSGCRTDGIAEDEAPLLGALLVQPKTRSAAVGRVRSLLSRLGRRTDADLHEALFLTIAAAHWYGPPYPDGAILRRLVQRRDPRVTDPEFDALLRGLHHEALARPRGSFLFTRHRLIAGTVCRMQEDAEIADRLAELLICIVEVERARTGGGQRIRMDGWKRDSLFFIAGNADPDRAVEALDALYSNTDDLTVHLTLGVALVRAGRIGQGIEMLAIWNPPNNARRRWLINGPNARLLAMALRMAANFLYPDRSSKGDWAMIIALCLHVFSLTGAARTDGHSPPRDECERSLLELRETLKSFIITPTGCREEVVQRALAQVSTWAGRLAARETAHQGTAELSKSLVALAKWCATWRRIPFTAILSQRSITPENWGVAPAMRTLFGR